MEQGNEKSGNKACGDCKEKKEGGRGGETDRSYAKKEKEHFFPFVQMMM